MVKQIIIENWQIIVGLIGSGIAFLTGRKMQTIEEKKANSDAVLSMQTVYDNFVKDIEARYIEMREEMQHVKSEVIQLRQENNELRKELRVWENKYNKLRIEFNKLTK
jgi:predicted nuclease with TOPRIM domain